MWKLNKMSIQLIQSVILHLEPCPHWLKAPATFASLISRLIQNLSFHYMKSGWRDEDEDLLYGVRIRINVSERKRWRFLRLARVSFSSNPRNTAQNHVNIFLVLLLLQAVEVHRIYSGRVRAVYLPCKSVGSSDAQLEAFSNFRYCVGEISSLTR